MSPREYSVYTIQREDRTYAGPVHRFHEMRFSSRELHPILPLVDHVGQSDEVVLYDQPVVELRTGPTESVFLAIEPRLARMFEHAAREGLRAEYQAALVAAMHDRDIVGAELRAARLQQQRFLALPWWKRAWRAVLGSLV